MPFCHIILKAQKLLNSQYPRELKTLGDHLRKRRFDLKLTQRTVAEQIGVHETTITNWELGRTEPEFKHLPNLIKFIGYLPLATTACLTLGEKIILYRQAHGKSQEKFAWELGIDPSTLGRWEKDRGHPSPKLIEKVEVFSQGQPLTHDVPALVSG